MMKQINMSGPIYLSVARVEITNIGTTTYGKFLVKDSEIVWPLYAKTQLWTNGEKSFLWIGLDECSIRTKDHLRLVKLISDGLEIPIEHISIFCVHNHSGHYYDSIDFQLLSAKLIEAVKNAANNKVKIIKIRQTLGELNDIINRRVLLNDKDGGYCVMFNHQCQADFQRKVLIVHDQVKQFANSMGVTAIAKGEMVTNHDIDNRIHLWEFLDESNQTVASNVRVNAHPVIVSQSRVGNKISGDYVGYLEKLIEDKVGGICSAMNGSFGDTRPLHENYDFETCQKFAAKYFDALLDNHYQVFENDLNEVILNLYQDLSLSLREDLPNTESLLISRGKEVNELIRANGSKKRLCDELEAINSFLLDSQNKVNALVYRDEIEAQTIRESIQSWCLGPMKIRMLPGEPLFHLSKEIEDKSGELAVGLVNGYRSYLPHPAMMNEGGYEVNQATLSQHALAKLINLPDDES